MKNLIVFAIALLTVGCVTSTVSKSKEEQLTTITEVSGKSKSEIYNRALEYIARSYTSSNDTIQLKDEDSGRIVAKAITYSVGDPKDFGIKRPFKFTLLIDAKDEKARIQFENIESINFDGRAGPNMQYQWDSVQQTLQNEIALIEKFITESEVDSW